MTKSLFLCVLPGAALGFEDEVAVRLPHMRAAKDAFELVKIPCAPLGDHKQLAADLQTVEALEDQPLGHGKVGLICLLYTSDAADE